VIGPLLVVLAAIGISAVVAHSVSDRRQEIGVRLALGATPRHVAGGLVVEMMWVIGAGAAAGWAIAFLIDRSLIESTSFDLTRFVAVPALLLGVGVVACWVPAIRATRRGPMHALRSS
jgi:ABC-type antimicrobial peptide transport system permease subunit